MLAILDKASGGKTAWRRFDAVPLDEIVASSVAAA
jgi:hypothetical protein